MKEKLTIYWSRRDFRLWDNPALFSAINFAKKENTLFLPVFILENYMCEAKPKFQFGYPQRVFLSKAIPLFFNKFESYMLVKGKVVNTFSNLNDIYDIQIFVNEDVYIDFYKQIEKLKNKNIKVEVLKDALTVSKETKTKTDNLYSVFTPFKKAVWSEFVNTKIYNKPIFKDLKFLPFAKIKDFAENTDLNEKDILENFSQNREFSAFGKVFDIDNFFPEKPDLKDWYFCEEEALLIFKSFMENKLSNYKKDRDYLDLEATSKMSLALAFGLVSSRMLTFLIKEKTKIDLENPFSEKNQGEIHFVSELIWREFYKYLFFHNPNLMQEEFQERFKNKIDWEGDKEGEKRFLAWIQGKTGYKIVDAAMIQLAKTGWMHNRARMIVSSILTKNLGVDWKLGQEYFRAMLIDLDEASNNGGWQWGASVGADPKPIRIFNPYLQAENYDQENKYQKKWLQEDFYLENLPIVDHKKAREEALSRYKLSKEDGEPRDF